MSDPFETLTLTIRALLPEFGQRPIERQDSMAALGLDSIDRAEVVLLSLDSLGIDAPVTRFHGARSLGELADLMRAARGT